MLQICKKLFSLWNSNDVIYCHWKGNYHLENALTGKSDFDILIAEESLVLGKELLCKAGFFLFKTQYGSRFPGIQDWIGVDSFTGTMIHIHLHQKMLAGHSGVMEYILPWESLAFTGRQMDSETGIYLLNPNLEIILLYTRFGIEKSPKKFKKVKGDLILKDTASSEVSYLKKNINIDICATIANKLFPSCHDLLLKIIKKEKLNTSDIAILSKLMENNCARWRRYGVTKVCILKWYKKFEGKVRKKYYDSTLRGIYRKTPVSGRGLTVAFVGKDEEVRTKVVRDIHKWLTWKIDANYINTSRYIFASSRFNILTTAFKTRLKVWNKKVLHMIERGVKLSAKGSIVLFDGFPVEELEYTIIPQPDIVIKVDDIILPYEEKLIFIKNTIWNKLNNTDYAK